LGTIRAFLALRVKIFLSMLAAQIDENLTWGSHIEYTKKKISCGLATLKRVKPFVKRDCLINIYKAIIEPYFNYCCLVWDSIGDTLSDKMQKMQNRAACIISGAPYDCVRTKDMFESLGWKTLKEKRLEQKAIMAYKIVNNQVPSYLSDLFENNIGKEIYNLRCSSTDLKLPRARTDVYKNGFVFTTAKLWNSLPEALKKEGTLKKFKRKVKQYKFEDSAK